MRYRGRGRWPGTWRAICDRCGFEFSNEGLKKEWTGLMVCHDCWEPRHPQELVRAKTDHQIPPWTRPEPEDLFVHYCSIESVSAYADLGTADCMQADNNQFTYAFLISLNDGYNV